MSAAGYSHFADIAMSVTSFVTKMAETIEIINPLLDDGRGVNAPLHFDP